MDISAEKPRVSGWMKLVEMLHVLAISTQRLSQRPSLPHLSARQARDMGLDPLDVERAQMVWPSQANVHPML